MNNLDNEQSSKIQIVRAIAIFCVVMIHTLPEGYIVVPIRIFLNCAVALFLFLSGLLTNLEIKDIRSFYQKRIFRVIIPYIIWTFIYTIIYYLFGIYKDIGFIQKLIYNLFSAKASGPLYFILVYIQLVLITPLIKILAVSKYKWLGFIIPIFSILFIMYLPTIIFRTSLWEYYMYPFTMWFAYYYLGITLSNGIFQDKIKNIGLLLITGLIMQLIEGSMWYYLGAKTIAISQLKVSSVICNLYILVVFYRFIINKTSFDISNAYNRFLIKVGNYSFGIYITHILIKNFLDLFVAKIYHLFPFYSCFVFASTLIFVYVLNKVMGKKVSKWLGLI